MEVLKVMKVNNIKEYLNNYLVIVLKYLFILLLFLFSYLFFIKEKWNNFNYFLKDITNKKKEIEQVERTIIKRIKENKKAFKRKIKEVQNDKYIYYFDGKKLEWKIIVK